MAGRRAKPEVNRRNWHGERVEKARTPKERLWALCHWLVAEAFHAGPDQMHSTTELIEQRINDLTEVRREASR
ncbi:hypothetical protein ABT336_11875 [Micromonospora sp. NPDC000207]|uniref:hypothetical protein n=1 Tax=Micromonospora sp. NPDC000207 TaxID=3154246 RepID=UPI00332F1A6A